MKLAPKLRSPAGLVAQGFVLGGVLFFTLHPLRPSLEPEPAAAGGVAIVETEQA